MFLYIFVQLWSGDLRLSLVFQVEALAVRYSYHLPIGLQAVTTNVKEALCSMYERLIH